MKPTIFIAGLLFASISFAADWPQFRGTDANGIATESAINKNWRTNPPKELWRVSMSDQGYGGPSVANGKLFIVDHRGELDIVKAFDLQTGKEAWSFSYSGPQKPNYGFTRSTPCINNGKVYTVSMDGKVHCLDEQTGNMIWMKDMPQEFGGKMPGWGYAMSVVIDGNSAILCPGGKNASVVAVDRDTGKLLWKSGTDQPGYATPVIATLNGIKQYVVFSATSVNGYSEKGRILWAFPWKTSYDVNAAAPIIIDDAVFVSSGYNSGCAVFDITPQGPVQRWRNKAMQQHFNSAIFHDGMIYGTTDPGDLVCLDPKTGDETWRHGGVEKGGLVAVDGVLIVISGGNGNVMMVEMNPQVYKEIGLIKPLSGQSWTAPIVADGKLIVRDLKNLVCLAIK